MFTFASLAIVRSATVDGVIRAGRAGGIASAGPANGIREQEFDLRVHAPQLVARPSLESGVELRIDPQEVALSWRHNERRLVQRARIDDWLRAPIAAQHHKQVRHHRGFAFLVEFDDVLIGEQM